MNQYDFSLNVRSKVDSFRALLAILLESFPQSLTHVEAIELESLDSSVLLVRHDVDHDLQKALAMARIENEMGIKASYYLLPPGDYDSDENYYGKIVDGQIEHSQLLRSHAVEIQSLGHEIGLHNDFVQLSDRTGRSVEDLLSSEIAFFKEIGIKILGIASHGSRFVRAHGFANYELFIDRKQGKPETKVIKYGSGNSISLPAINMSDYGLLYEAYDLPRNVRISDVGGKLLMSSQSETVQTDFLNKKFIDGHIDDKGYCIVLIHPEHWLQYHLPVLSGSHQTPKQGQDKVFKGSNQNIEKPSFVRADGTPFRIAARGDCVCRRGIQMNADLFPNGFKITINEKATNQQFVEHLQGSTATLEDAKKWVDVDSMVGSLANYFKFQFDRSTMDLEDIDLLVMDTYSDMNFQLWRNKAEGWSMWVHPKFTDMDRLKQDFENLGFIGFEETVEAVCAYIDYIRQKKSDLPVLFMYQPVEYYKKLENRTSFYDLPVEISRRRENVYASKQLSFEQLGVADLGSCGEGQTLHFDKETYLKMIESAWESGLSKHFASVSVDTELLSDQPPPDLLSAIVPSIYPKTKISYGKDRPLCLTTCEKSVDLAFKSFAQYCIHPEYDESAEAKRFLPMVIAIGPEFSFDFDDWESGIKKFGKGARLRQKRKAERAGYYCKLFPWRLHIPDVHEINHSKESRSGGAMRGSYLRSVDEMGGAPKQHFEVVVPRCNSHWNLTFGAFEPQQDYAQGEFVTNEKLIAYVSLRRIGDVALYSQILGHGDYLNAGTLVLLHHHIVKWAHENRDGLSKGLRFLMYGGAQNGGQNLYKWKRQGGFVPRQIVGFSDDNALINGSLDADV